jgi:hypothetical protein
MVEVGDVGGRTAAPADLDRLPERVEEPVAEAVSDVTVVDATDLRGLAREVRELVGRRVCAGRVVEAGAQPERPVLQRLADQAPHHGARRGRGGLVLPADRPDPDGRVANERRDVQAATAEAIEIPVHRGPVEGDASRVAVEAGIHLAESSEVGRACERGVAEPVHSDELGRHALAHLRAVVRVGEDHEPAVRVQVDEPRADDLSGRVDPAARVQPVAGSRVQQPNAVPIDRDVAEPAGRTRPINDRAATDQELDAVGHDRLPVARPLRESVSPPDPRPGNRRSAPTRPRSVSPVRGPRVGPASSRSGATS